MEVGSALRFLFQIKDARLSNKSLTQFFDTTAFAPQPLGTIGTAQRNSLFGPNFRHVDLSIFKDFPVTERLKVQFRAESFNLGNTPQFSVPNNTFGNAQFGQVTSTQTGTERHVQFALRLQF